MATEKPVEELLKPYDNVFENMQQPTVSIIMPLYNAEMFVEQSVRSVISQTFQDWELIVVDDCSSDSSAAIVERLSNEDQRIKLLHTQSPSGSPTLPRNIAIENATGRYIAFLDSDDLWLPEKLELQLKMFADSDTVAVFSDYEKIDEQGNRDARVINAPSYTNYNKLLYSNVIGNLTGMYDVTKRGKRYMKNIHHEDFAFWLDILKDGGIARNAGVVTALYRERKGSLSSNKLKILKWHWDVLRKEEHLSLFNALWHYNVYAVKAFLKSIV